MTTTPNNKVEEIEKEFLGTSVNFDGLSLGDMVLHNGEELKEILEFSKALSKALTSSYEQGVRDERERLEKIIRHTVDIGETVIKNDDWKEGRRDLKLEILQSLKNN